MLKLTSTISWAVFCSIKIESFFYQVRSGFTFFTDPDLVNIDPDPDKANINPDLETVNIDPDPDTVNIDPDPDTVNTDPDPDR